MKKILLLALAVFTYSFATRAQEMLQYITPDIKSLGMGGITMTDISGVNAIFNNPAGAAFSQQKVQLSGSYMPMNTTHTFAASGSFNFDGSNTLEAGWRRSSNKVHTTWSSDMTFELGYARRLSQKWSIGATLRHYRFSTDWDASGTKTLAVDVGALYSLPLDMAEYSTFRLGMKVGNIGGYIGNRGSLPFSTTIGVALDTFITDAHEVTVGLDVNSFFTQGSQTEWGVSLGAEYNIMQLIQLRVGGHLSNDTDYSSYGSVGAGVRFLHARLDFAYLFGEQASPLHNAWSIGLGFDF